MRGERSAVDNAENRFNREGWLNNFFIHDSGGFGFSQGDFNDLAGF